MVLSITGPLDSIIPAKDHLGAKSCWEYRLQRVFGHIVCPTCSQPNLKFLPFPRSYLFLADRLPQIHGSCLLRDHGTEPLSGKGCQILISSDGELCSHLSPTSRPATVEETYRDTPKDPLVGHIESIGINTLVDMCIFEVYNMLSGRFTPLISFDLASSLV